MWGNGRGEEARGGTMEEHEWLLKIGILTIQYRINPLAHASMLQAPKCDSDDSK